MKKILLLLLSITAVLFSQNKVKKKEVYSPEKTGIMNFKSINESSGLVNSSLWPEVLWTLNDSGDKARIFPVKSDGSSIIPEWSKEWYEGLNIHGAYNIDWEDIAKDDKGNLIIGACGNNYNYRRDLCLYFIQEPNPYSAVETRVFKTVFFKYPDQKKFPPAKDNRNFDCEAVFYDNESVYFLSKNRSNSNTKLYKLSELKTDVVNELVLLGEFPVGGMVTAADIDKSGNRIAVLTYNSIWLFEKPSDSDNYIKGKSYYLPLNEEVTKQCEAVAFMGNDLIISNEQRDLFKVPLSDLKENK